MKRLILGISCLLLTETLLAIPAKRVTKTITQSDGSLIEVCLIGDEAFHCYTTSDGMPLISTEKGFCYAKVNGDKFMSTGVLAHESGKRSLDETSFLLFSKEENQSAVHALWNKRMNARNAHRVEIAEKNRISSERKKSRKTANSATTKKGLVILVSFSDTEMTHTQTEFDAQFNQEGYNLNRHIGSVRDYFKDQSDGQLIIDFDVVGPYKLSNKMSYYGGNDSDGEDQRPGQMVAEACNMADADVNFADYDWDGDGEVDQVYVIYAGYGEASGASDDTIWPHEWALSSSDYRKSLKLDGVTVDVYACSNELSGTSGSMMDGIGTACHEFSHCLGLPDLYDTSPSGSSFGMGTWSLMDYGCYNGPSGYEGNVPCAYTAYERFYAGWIEPTELTNGCKVTDMAAITDKPESYILYNDNHRDEYYLLTNIQLKSWNRYAYGHGLLVIHVDYDEDAWWNNEVNNSSSHQRCSIIPADNAAPALSSKPSTWTSLGGDPYPGTSSNTSLTDESKPAATLFNSNSDGKKLMGKPIENITESSGLISFTFNGGVTLSAPVATEATDVGNGSFMANWNAVDEAESYTIELLQLSETKLIRIFNEDFSNLKASSVSTSTDISGQINSYLSQDGWTGSKLFRSTSDGIKLGSSKDIGTITTPLISAPSSRSVTLNLDAAPYGLNSAAAFKVTVGDETLNVECDGDKPVMIIFSEVSEDFFVSISTIESATRAFINDIRIYDGNATDADVASFDDGDTITVQAMQSCQTVTGLTETEYKFSGLEDGEYYYRVQTVVGSRTSSWSNLIQVTLGKLKGDVNEDGTVDINDVVAVINHISETVSWRYADVNEDGTVDINDVVAVINIMAGENENE